MFDIKYYKSNKKLRYNEIDETKVLICLTFGNL